MIYFTRNLYDRMVADMWIHMCLQNEDDYEKLKNELFGIMPELRQLDLKRENLLSMSGPTDKLMKMIEEKFEKRWDEASIAYEEEFKKIEKLLPESMQKIANFSLHDVEILDIHRPTEDILIIKLLDTWCGETHLNLTFTGVKFAEIPNENLLDECVWTEVHL